MNYNIIPFNYERNVKLFYFTYNLFYKLCKLLFIYLIKFRKTKNIY